MPKASQNGQPFLTVSQSSEISPNLVTLLYLKATIAVYISGGVYKYALDCAIYLEEMLLPIPIYLGKSQVTGLIQFLDLDICSEINYRLKMLK